MCGKGAARKLQICCGKGRGPPNPLRRIGSQAGRKQKPPVTAKEIHLAGLPRKRKRSMTAEEKHLALARKCKQCSKKRRRCDGELLCDICLKEKRQCVYAKDTEDVVAPTRNCEL